MTADCHHDCELRPEPTQPGRASVCAGAKVESSSAAPSALAGRGRILKEVIVRAAGREKICIDKSVAFDHVAAPYLDATRAAASRKHRPGADEGMKLSALAAGVDCGGQLVQQCLIKDAPRKAPVELPRVDADEMRAHSSRDHLARQPLRGDLPAGKEWLEARTRQLGLAIRTDVLEEEIAKRNSLDTFSNRSRTGCGHRRLVLLVGARPRQRNRPQRKSRSHGLLFQQLAPEAMHRYAVKVRVDRCEQADDLVLWPRL